MGDDARHAGENAFGAGEGTDRDESRYAAHTLSLSDGSARSLMLGYLPRTAHGLQLRSGPSGVAVQGWRRAHLNETHQDQVVSTLHTRGVRT